MSQQFERIANSIEHLPVSRQGGTEHLIILDQSGTKIGETLVSFWKKNYRPR